MIIIKANYVILKNVHEFLYAQKKNQNDIWLLLFFLLSCVNKDIIMLNWSLYICNITLLKSYKFQM